MPRELPGVLGVMRHRFGKPQLERDFSTVFSDALEHAAPGTCAPPRIQVKRRRPQPGDVNLGPLPQYVDFRVAQGADVGDAVAEWNGAQLVLGQS